MATLNFNENGNSYSYDLSGYVIVLAHSGGCEKLEKSRSGKVTFWVYDGNNWINEPTPKTEHIAKIKKAWKAIA